MPDLSAYPRASLCHRPTPLELMPRLTEHLGGPTLWIKRDDCTGLATGGNKTRKLEFLLGEALAQSADVLVTQGAVQSNHVRQTAAAACHFGLACHALLERRVPDATNDYENSGNVLLDRLFGTTIEYWPAGSDMNQEAERVGERLRAAGHNAYVIPGGGSNTTGALGYVECANELAEQASAQGFSIDALVTATGSTGTHAGLLAGLHADRHAIPVIGVSVRQPRERQIGAVHKLAVATAERLGVPDVPVETVLVDDGYIGAGYGIAAESTVEAIEVMAKTEGILLDPVYSGKAFAGLLGLIRAGHFDRDAHVVFLHTGGAAALFAYGELFAPH